MEFICRQSQLSGKVPIPGSKSHTIRAVLLAGLADGESTLIEPLTSADTGGCCRRLSTLRGWIQISEGCMESTR